MSFVVSIGMRSRYDRFGTSERPCQYPFHRAPLRAPTGGTVKAMTTTWTSDELSRIEAADELEIAPRRRDGTLRKLVPIWAVRVADDV